MPSVIPLDAPKSEGYYGLARAEVLAHLPRPVGRALDVGCGEGGAASVLRDAGATWISGIEILEEPAARAAEVYDEVLVGDALEQLDNASGPFQSVLCYDVLEHLYDPLALVAALRRHTSPGAHLHVSVPNASHISLLRDLIFRGTFGYTPFGHRDATHLRWFTRRDIIGLVREAGWTVVAVRPSQLHKSKHLHTLSRGRSTEFLAGQWFVLARNDQ